VDLYLLGSHAGRASRSPGAQINVSSENVALIGLVVVPVLAALCLGLSARMFVEGAFNYMVAWLLVLVACCGTWLYFLTRVE
jgi:hypothetical protein